MSGESIAIWESPRTFPRSKGVVHLGLRKTKRKGASWSNIREKTDAGGGGEKLSIRGAALRHARGETNHTSFWTSVIADE